MQLKLKSTPIIMQDFSIVGIKKQWEWQEFNKDKKPCLNGQNKCSSTACENCCDNFKRWVVAGTPEFPGRKTETRRTRGLDEVNADPDGWGFNEFRELEGNLYALFEMIDSRGEYHSRLIKCPYGQVGDELWVKEAYNDGFVNAIGDNVIAYEADVDNPEWLVGHEEYKKRKWKSPLFMPKAASRIRLEITSIKVERVQDITEEGALREGVFYDGKYKYWVIGDTDKHAMYCDKEFGAVHLFNQVFIDLHGEELLAKNPWVWVIQFTVKSFA